MNILDFNFWKQEIKEKRSCMRDLDLNPTCLTESIMLPSSQLGVAHPDELIVSKN